MKRIVMTLILLGSAAADARSFANVDKAGVALSGYDPVSYFQGGKPLKGDAKFQTKRDDITYFFASESNKQTFLREPEKYEPQFGGWCAYAVADSSSKVEVDPESFVIQDGRLLLFYNGLWGDTRGKWLNTKSKDSKSFLKEADAHWPAVKPKEP